jgi:hypothetical protein
LRIQLLQQRGAAVEPFGERFERRPIVQRVERCLVREVHRDVGRERPGDIGVGNGVLDQRRHVSARGGELLPRHIIQLTGCRQLA